MQSLRFAAFGAVLATGVACADSVTVQLNLVETGGVGKSIGTVMASSGPYGTIFTPGLSDLTPGPHGFHVHESPNCGAKEKDGKMVPGLAAGGHYDPTGTGAHKGPYADGHLGDLPVLYVNGDGRATLPILAPRVKVSDLKGRSLMIHAHGDNYSDEPQPLGGGGPRVACGVIK
jgi:Cu-Zn family superoxide dismutase